MPNLVRSPVARKIWRQLVPMLERMRVLTKADGMRLADLCNDAALYWECDAVIRTEGLTLKTYNGEGKVMSTVKHPLHSVMNAAQTRYSRSAARFGLTPAERNTLIAGPGDDDDDGVLS